MISPWPGLSDAPEPADPFVGPFPCDEFLTTWWDHLGTGEPVTLRRAGTALPLVSVDGALSCAGDASVTDYHSPLGTDYEELAIGLMELEQTATSVTLDSLPGDSARGLHEALTDLGAAPAIVEADLTAVVEIEGEYLDGLSKKQRHEVRRKYRRFLETAGQPTLDRSPDGAFDRFVDLHRQSAGEKGSFLDGPMQGFFDGLASLPGWEFSELVTSGMTVASLFGFRSAETYYLYNSAFDPRFREASPGIVALYLLIEDLVQSGCRRVDFLKGDEVYKFRMGAARRPLYTVVL